MSAGSNRRVIGAPIGLVYRRYFLAFAIGKGVNTFGQFQKCVVFAIDAVACQDRLKVTAISQLGGTGQVGDSPNQA